MVTKVQRWGNSLGLRIPKSVADEAHMKEGSEVDVRLVNGEMVVRPVARPKYQLKDLLKRVTVKNRHKETSTGSPVGREEW